MLQTIEDPLTNTEEAAGNELLFINPAAAAEFNLRCVLWMELNWFVHLDFKYYSWKFAFVLFVLQVYIVCTSWKRWIYMVKCLGKGQYCGNKVIRLFK